MNVSDLERLQDVYNKRKETAAVADRYTVFDPAFHFLRVQRQRAIIGMLKACGIHSLRPLTMLEVGCGNGSVIQEFLSFGARTNCMHGIDLLHSRMVGVQRRLPLATFLCANGTRIPLASGSFDLVMQFTALSSILDPATRKQIAAEMRRVTKPGGLILWYDFIWNPSNAETCGISKHEIVESFPGCSFTFRRITLMPPLARRVAPVSWQLGMLLEKLGVFNSHYLVGIRKG